MAEFETPLTDDRETTDGRRRLQLTEQERREFQERERIEKLVSMFLDLERKFTRQEMCDELGVSNKTIKRLTETDLFKEIYEDHLSTLGHDPRLQAVQSGLIDLLPYAFEQLKVAVTGLNVPWTVKYKAIQDIMRLNGIQPKAVAQSDRKELAEFLGGLSRAPQIGEMHVHLPESYRDAQRAAEDGDIVTVEPINVTPDDEEPRQVTASTPDPPHFVAT